MLQGSQITAAAAQRAAGSRDEKLAAVGVWASVHHGQAACGEANQRWG